MGVFLVFLSLGTLAAPRCVVAAESPAAALQSEASASTPTNQATPAEANDLVALDDQELAQIGAGEFQIALDDFTVSIQDNQAGSFSLDIAQSAFGAAQGIFTTLQAVNSAVDLTVIVNIFLNGSGQSGP